MSVYPLKLTIQMLLHLQEHVDGRISQPIMRKLLEKGSDTLEFYHLEVFVAVADCRSFSKAAEKLFLSQPTVSAHIKNLENELQTLLFERKKDDLRLTPPGRTLYRHAQDILEMRRRLLSDLAADDSEEEVITVVASSVPCQYLLPRAIKEFKLDYPHILVNLRQKNSRSVCEDILNYQYAIGIVGEKIRLPQLAFKPLKRDELVCAIPLLPEYEELLKKEYLTPKDLLRYNLLVREPGSGTRSLFEQALIKAGDSLENYHYQVFNNQETIKQAVKQGLGISVLSRYVVDDYVRFGLLAVRPLTGLELARNFYLVVHEKRVQATAVRALNDFLCTFFNREEDNENNLRR